VGISANNFSPEHLVRAAVEGVSFGILNGLDLILSGKAAERILVIGGGARSAAWRQLLADATGAVIEVPAETEAGCLGAAMQACFAYSAAKGLGDTFTGIADRWVRVDEGSTALPRKEFEKTYTLARKRYAEALESLYGVFPAGG